MLKVVSLLPITILLSSCNWLGGSYINNVKLPILDRLTITATQVVPTAITMDHNTNIVYMAAKGNSYHLKSNDTASYEYGSIWREDSMGNLEELLIGSASDKLGEPLDILYNPVYKSLFVCHYTESTGTAALTEPKKASISEYAVDDAGLHFQHSWTTLTSSDTTNKDYCFKLAQLSSGQVIATNANTRSSSKNETPALFIINPDKEVLNAKVMCTYAQLNPTWTTTEPIKGKITGIAVDASNNIFLGYADETLLPSFMIYYSNDEAKTFSGYSTYVHNKNIYPVAIAIGKRDPHNSFPSVYVLGSEKDNILDRSKDTVCHMIFAQYHENSKTTWGTKILYSFGLSETDKYKCYGFERINSIDKSYVLAFKEPTDHGITIELR